MIVAEKLGYTLQELGDRITPAELMLWSAFYQIRQEAEEAAMRKAKRAREASRYSQTRSARRSSC